MFRWKQAREKSHWWEEGGGAGGFEGRREENGTVRLFPKLSFEGTSHSIVLVVITLITVQATLIGIFHKIQPSWPKSVHKTI